MIKTSNTELRGQGESTLHVQYMNYTRTSLQKCHFTDEPFSLLKLLMNCAVDQIC